MIKMKNIATIMIKENNESYSVMCSALGVYGIGKTKQDAKKNFTDALDIHLAILRKKALEIS